MEITSCDMLKPAYTTPHSLAGENVPLTAFDRAAFDVFVPMVLAYGAPSPSNEAVMEGLLMAVAAYPHMAGRFAVDRHGGRRRRLLHVNNEGVLVLEATVEADLADVLAANFVVATDLYPSAPQPDDYVGAALLQIKLSRFRCGGLVVGLIAHHHVCDGHSMSAFCTTWARAVREGEAFNVPSPSLDRAVTGLPRRPPAPVFDHRTTEFKVGNHSGSKSFGTGAVDTSADMKIRNLAVHFTAEFVAELKARARVGAGGWCTTFECLLAHAWKKITAARGLKPEEFTRVRVAVNCRRRANPPVPADLFGNMVLWAFPRLQVRHLLSASYGDVASAIRAAVARIDGEYIQSFVDYVEAADASGEELAATAAEPGEALFPDLEVDSWLGFRFHEMDLGTGPPAAVLAPDLPIDGLMIVMPATTAGAGVDLFVALAEDHAQAFEQICYSLEEHPMSNPGNW